VTVAVRYDVAAALLNKVCSSVKAVLVFANGILPDNLVFFNTCVRCGFLNAVDVSKVIACVFVVDENYAYFQFRGCTLIVCLLMFVLGAVRQCKLQGKGKKHCKYFHVFPRIKI
jgi:hypothetical protein